MPPLLEVGASGWSSNRSPPPSGCHPTGGSPPLPTPFQPEGGYLRLDRQPEVPPPPVLLLFTALTSIKGGGGVSLALGPPSPRKIAERPLKVVRSCGNTPVVGKFAKISPVVGKMGKTTCQPLRSSRIAWKLLVGPENGTKPLVSSKGDRAQSGNALGTTRWSGNHVTSLKRRALSWVGPELIPLAKDARKSQLMTKMSEHANQWRRHLRKSTNGQSTPERQEMAWLFEKAKKWQGCPRKQKK
ncbi:hypothetical protein Taro_002715 [Colocasia esculenta]|uniref:Uncharacterized protein n=1 Tax=Colocasia esculenta TaxID=4460 RepID=A0A843TDG5_COLES|nr:hypothetical protein [Colocasia esculenta]